MTIETIALDASYTVHADATEVDRTEGLAGQTRLSRSLSRRVGQ